MPEIRDWLAHWARLMKILVLNGGSSSIKCRYDDLQGPPPSDPPSPLWSRSLDLKTNDSLRCGPAFPSGPVDVVGHRIVHGGPIHKTSFFTNDVRAAIEAASEIAPAHNRRELHASIRFVKFSEKARRKSSFSILLFTPRSRPRLTSTRVRMLGSRRYPTLRIPWDQPSIRLSKSRGASWRRAGEVENRHLYFGNGASLAAVRGGTCIDTTMGFTPLEGLMMGSRSGSIDPAILVYLMRRHRLHGRSSRRSSESRIGSSRDFGRIGRYARSAGGNRSGKRARASGLRYLHTPSCARDRSHTGVLGGLDALVFTGGVGENCAPLRERVVEHLAFLKPRMLVIHAEEEWEIARECWQLHPQ